MPTLTGPQAEPGHHPQGVLAMPSAPAPGLMAPLLRPWFGAACPLPLPAQGGAPGLGRASSRPSACDAADGHTGAAEPSTFGGLVSRGEGLPWAPWPGVARGDPCLEPAAGSPEPGPWSLDPSPRLTRQGECPGCGSPQGPGSRGLCWLHLRRVSAPRAAFGGVGGGWALDSEIGLGRQDEGTRLLVTCAATSRAGS